MRGFIPAHAGKTRHVSDPSPPSAAHPRSRGENWAWLIEYGDPAGSSPLTRGKLDRTTDPRRAAWLIPAHAGKTAC